MIGYKVSAAILKLPVQSQEVPSGNLNIFGVKMAVDRKFLVYQYILENK